MLMTQKRNVIPVINAIPGIKTENLLNSKRTNGMPAIKPNNGVVIIIVSSSLFLSFLFFKISFMLVSNAQRCSLQFVFSIAGNSFNNLYC
jgi:hypothetical protein